MRPETEIISSFYSDDNIRQVNLFANGITEFWINGELLKTVDLSYLTNQEQEDRAEEFVSNT